VRALLPVITLYVGKLIIDEVVRLAGGGLVNHPCATGSRAASSTHRLPACAGVRSRGRLRRAGRYVSLLDSLLSERFSTETSLRLMEHAATLDLEDFEDSELQDRLERAGGRRRAARA
jgi:ATP-binding cassette subfamily B protein